MAQVAGAVIVSLVVSQAVSQLGPKLGLSESTSNMLGMAAGMYAGGMVGAGSTAGTEAAATGAGTTSQVGADIPAGYGGPSNIPGTPLAPAGSPYASAQSAGAGVSPAAPAAGTDIMAGSSASRAAAQGARMGSPTTQITGQAPTQFQAEGLTEAGQQLVDVPGRDVGGPPSTRPTDPSGYLEQAGIQSSPTTGSPTVQTPTGDTASNIIESQGLVGRTAGGSEDTNWWQRMFSPEKTMDLAIAGLQGYSEAAMAEEEREYAEKIAQQNADEWGRAYGTRVRSLNQNYPSGYRGP